MVLSARIRPRWVRMIWSARARPRPVPSPVFFVVKKGFFKVDSFTPGTGLGLSIARQVMDIVDGKIYLDTSYNSGVRVVVEWPMN